MPLVHLTTAVGSPFEVRRFRVREALDDTFVVEVTGTALDPNVDLEAIIGREASFELQSGYAHGGRGHRVWTGICNHVEQVHGSDTDGANKTQSTYRILVAPSLWLLTQRTNYRIFQRLSLPDIVDAVLDEWHVQRTWKVNKGAYPKLEYKTQYAETDFAFVSRLLEEAGIAYTFAGPDDGGPAVVLSDDLPRHPLADHGSLPYEENPTESAEREYASRVAFAVGVRPGAHHLVDFNFRNPSFQLEGDAHKAPEPEDRLERYDYVPGGFKVESKKDGTSPQADDHGAYRAEGSYGGKRAQRILEAERTGRRILEFKTNSIDLAPGTATKIDHHPNGHLAEKLLVTGFEIEGGPNSEWNLKVRAVFRKDAYRPAMRTPKPRIWGVQSATVTGPGGQEIHTDEFGRVRVHFPWDRKGTSDDESSVWMRVNQGWSGTGFGMVTLPRVGQEVLVGFLDGDPDAPIVVGRVYNALNPVPYKLPENKTVSGWKTHSSPTSGGYNEIKLEDKADKELIYLQAQKDMHELVKRDERKRVERKQHQTVADDQHLVVKKIKKELVEVDDHLHVKGDQFEKVDKSTSLTIGIDQDVKVGSKSALDAGQEIHLKAGTRIVIEAGEVTLKGGGGFVHIHSGGVDVVGTLVKINSGGAAGKGSGAKPTEPKDAEEAKPVDSSDQIED